VAEDDHVPPEAPPLSAAAHASDRPAAGAPEASELESTVLGIVWRSKETTAYALRGVFRESPSLQWSGSAGAIYPLVARLERRGWLRSRTHRTGRREGRMYTLTAAGLRVLRAWLGPPLSPAATSVVPDPLRTRIFFIGALTPEERVKFLEEAEKGLAAELAACADYAKQSGADEDAVIRAAFDGVLATTKARLEWIRALRASSPGAGA
jgi:DNA-binding PadR family transcriptional regulator